MVVGDGSTDIVRGGEDVALAADERVAWRAGGAGGPAARARSDVLPVRECTAASPGALLLALPLGVASGALLATLAAGRAPDVHASPLAWRLLAAGAALLSAWLFARGARSLFPVLERGLLAGAAEWLALALPGAPRALPEALALQGVDDVLSSGLLTRGQPAGLVGSPLALALAAACVAGWLFVGRLHREWALDEPGLRR